MYYRARETLSYNYLEIFSILDVLETKVAAILESKMAAISSFIFVKYLGFWGG